MSALQVSMTSAQPLQRVFKIDISTCADCGDVTKVIASMEDLIQTKTILNHQLWRAEALTSAFRPVTRVSPQQETRA